MAATPPDQRPAHDDDPAAAVARRIPLLTRPLVLSLVGIVVVVIGGLVWMAFGSAPDIVTGPSVLGPRGDIRLLRAPVDGTVEDLTVGGGARLARGDVVLHLRRPDGSLTLVRSASAGWLVDLRVGSGVSVSAGDTVAIVTDSLRAGQALAFLPAGTGQAARPGMKAFVSPDDIPASQYGKIEAEVVEVSATAVSANRVTSLVRGNTSLARYLMRGGPVVEVQLQLATDPSTPSGLRWSVGSGPDRRISAGSLATSSVVLADESLAQALAP